MRHLDDLLNGNGYTTTTEVCPGCENHCTVKRYLFDNGQTYHSGNQCEKIYSNTKLSERKGFNMFAWKNMLLFRQDKPKKGTYRMYDLKTVFGKNENCFERSHDSSKKVKTSIVHTE